MISKNFATCQRIESRRLLSATFSLSGVGLLTVLGDDAPNQIVIQHTRINGELLYSVNVDFHLQTYPLKAIKRLNITTKGGNDSVTVGIPADMTLDCGDGNDLVSYGPGSFPTTPHSLLHGGKGEDTIYVTGGINTVYGDAGNDHIIADDTTTYDVLRGGDGNDTIQVNKGGSNALFGDNGNDTLIGGTGNDYLSGLAGNDLLEGGAGNDTLDGGAGKDALHGKDGNDILDGGAGDDYLDGGKGNDSVDYSKRTTPIAAEIRFDNSGSYIARGDGGAMSEDDTQILENDTYYEVETILGGSAGDHIAFHNGNFLQGSTRGLLLVGNGGDDMIRAGDTGRVDHRSLVSVRGGAGDDQITTMATKVQVWGDGENDTLDLFDTTSTAIVTADLGSGFDTTIFVTGSNNGTPHITLPAGCERFQGSGNMVITGNALDNVFDLRAWPATTIQVFALGGNDLITVPRGVNGPKLIADGGAGNDTIFSGDANDRLNGGSGNDRIDGFDGNDTIYGDNGNDLLLGEKDNDQLHGGTGDDSLWGGTGDDTLYGDAGHDKLYGEANNDFLFAKDGSIDSLNGGGGFDTAQRDNSSIIKDSVLSIESFI